MRRSTFVASLSAIVVGAPLAASAADAKPIVIGFFAPMTGNSGQYGVQFKNAIDLFIEQYNKHGMRGAPLQLLVRDDQAVPREAANAAQEFAQNNDLMAAVGSFSSTASMAAAPIFLKAGIVQISPSSSDPAYTRIGNFMFRMADTQAIQAPHNAEYIVKKLKAKKIAVLYRQDDFGLAAGPPLAKAAEGLGAQVVISEAVVSGTTDFRPLVNRLQAAKPDALYVATFYADAAVLAKQMQEAGLKLKVVTNSSVLSPQLIKLGGSAVNGWYTPTEFNTESGKRNIKDFVTAYKAKYAVEPDLFAAEAWDTIGLLAKAMENATERKKPLTRDGIREALVKIKYDGVTGTVAYDENRDVSKSFSWLEIIDGKYVPIKG